MRTKLQVENAKTVIDGQYPNLIDKTSTPFTKELHG